MAFSLAIVLASSLTSQAAAQDSARQTKRTSIVGRERAKLGHWPRQAVLRLHSATGQVPHCFCGGRVLT
jgi:secreted trypsin-like serine protease